MGSRKGWFNFLSFTLALLTSLKPTWSQNNFQTDPTRQWGRKADSPNARAASRHFSKLPDTHAVVTPPEAVCLAFGIFFTKKHIQLHNWTSPWRGWHQKEDRKRSFLKIEQFTFSTFLNLGSQLLLGNFFLCFDYEWGKNHSEDRGIEVRFRAEAEEIPMKKQLISE